MNVQDKNGNFIVETSRTFAEYKHKGQVRKRTGVPYFNHLANVAGLVRANNGTDVQIAIAYLHDVIEDTDTTYSELLELFPIEVADGVLALSNDRDEEIQKGKVAYLVHKVSSLSDDLLMVKLCDIFDNTVDISESDDTEWKQKFYDKYTAVINGLSSVSGKNNELVRKIKTALMKLKRSINGRMLKDFPESIRKDYREQILIENVINKLLDTGDNQSCVIRLDEVDARNYLLQYREGEFRVKHDSVLEPDISFNRDDTTILSEGINDFNLLKATFIIGCAGSGKSTIVKEYAKWCDGIKVIDSDEFYLTAVIKYYLEGKGIGTDLKNVLEFRRKFRKGKLPEIGEIWFGNEELERLRSTSIKSLVSEAGTNWIDGLLPIIIDGTGKNFTRIKTQTEFLKSLGYDVNCILVDVSEEVAVKRNKKRREHTGKGLDDEAVRNMWKVIQTLRYHYEDYFGKSFRSINNDHPLTSATSKNHFLIIQDIAKKFFNGKPNNELGQNVTKELQQSGLKYLSDLFSSIRVEINKILSL